MKRGGLTLARLAYNDQGIPYSAEYDDVYHSADGGIAQARHVFLAGNGLPERWRDRDSFTIIETGFGLGLNFLCTWQSWRGDPRGASRLHFVSVEQHPFSRQDLEKLHASWPELAPLAAELRRRWPLPIAGIHRLHFAGGRLTLTLLLGAAEQMLPSLLASADALYLDGFAPAKNPALWSLDVLRALTNLARPGATLATWSVAVVPREALAAAGWQLEKRPGFGQKREMLVGTRPGACAAAKTERSAMIIGAGIAGASLAERLAQRGWAVSLFDRQLGPALEGSGNPAGIFLPLPAKDDNLVARISRACFLYAAQRLDDLAASPAGTGLRWEACGVAQLARDARHAELQRQSVARLGLPAAFMRFLEREEMATLLGRTVPLGGWHFPGGGWLSPTTLCRALLADELATRRTTQRISQRYATTVSSIAATSEGWLVRDAAGKTLGEAAHLILANAQDALRFLPDLPLQRVRGQITCLPMRPFTGLTQAVCRKSYLIPSAAAGPDGVAYLGASFDIDDEETQLRQRSHEENLAGLEAMLPGAMLPGGRGIDAAHLPGRVGFRSMSPDRLPLAGTLPQPVATLRSDLQLAAMERQSGLHCLLGYGARGMVWALLLAELLAAQLEGEPLPLERELVAALDPARFLFRRLRRG